MKGVDHLQHHDEDGGDALATTLRVMSRADDSLKFRSVDRDETVSDLESRYNSLQYSIYSTSK